MTITLNIRLAHAEDAEAITNLINAAFEVERFFLDSDRIDIDRVHKLFHNGTVLLAEDESGIIGCVYLEPNGDSMYLGLLSVAPNRQRTGLGAALIHAAEKFSKDKASMQLNCGSLMSGKNFPVITAVSGLSKPAPPRFRRKSRLLYPVIS